MRIHSVRIGRPTHKAYSVASVLGVEVVDEDTDEAPVLETAR